MKEKTLRIHDEIISVTKLVVSKLVENDWAPAFTRANLGA